jgi:membrane protein DedA with SNARE-associated domain
MFDWIVSTVEQAGYLGIALLMFAENLFPSIPSELIMPLAGFTAARGELEIALIVVAGTAGSLMGALLWYYVGRWLGYGRLRRLAARHGRWLTLSPGELDQARAWFRLHCGKAVFFGRLVPAVRTLISVPAGIAGMALVPFLAYSTAGSALWTGLLAMAGYLLEDQYEEVSSYLNPASNVIVAIIAVWYIYRVATFRREHAG